MNYILINLFIGLQSQVEAVDKIKEKIANAPEDSNYEMGVIIANYLPFLFLAIIAYLIFFSAKKDAKFDE